MQMIDAQAVHAHLPYARLIPALIQAHRADVDARMETVFDQPSSGDGDGVDNFLVLPAWQRGRALGAKLATVFPENERNGSGLPSIHAVVVLFDGADGRPLGVIDGTALTVRKTAADSGMGATWLAPAQAERLLMVGAGAMAPHLIQAHLTARPTIREVAIWNRSPERAKSLGGTLNIPGVSVTAIDDLEAAACRADVISCATMATDPLIRGAWLKPGTHLDLVGSFRPDMLECDAVALVTGSIFVDSRWMALEKGGEIQAALASGQITPDAVLADAFQLAQGKHPGRRTADEITVYKNGGGGHLDVMVAQILLDAVNATVNAAD
ncbi:MAG: ornithine cyclodeaminase [Pseudomonadota bacterium]